MAFMLPDQVESFKTEGEGRFYRFLAAVAKPDQSYIAWYTPDLQGKEPDFVLYSDSVGLIVLEVKDWALHQIREADPSRFTLDVNGVPTARRNPFKRVCGAAGRCDRLHPASGSRRLRRWRSSPGCYPFAASARL